jgi:hypothetical protein
VAGPAFWHSSGTAPKDCRDPIALFISQWRCLGDNLGDMLSNHVGGEISSGSD